MHISHHAPITETELITAISQPLDALIRLRYNVLIGKRNAETLTSPEYEELQSLTDVVEADHLHRWENLARLAALQEVEIMTVAARFGLVPAASATVS